MGAGKPRGNTGSCNLSWKMSPSELRACVRAAGAARPSAAKALAQRADAVVKEGRVTVKRCCPGRKKGWRRRTRTMDRSRVHHSLILRPSTFPKPPLPACQLLMISSFLDLCSPPYESAVPEQTSLFTFTKGARLGGWQRHKGPASLLQAAREAEGGYCCTQKAPA